MEKSNHSSYIKKLKNNPYFNSINEFVVLHPKESDKQGVSVLVARKHNQYIDKKIEHTLNHLCSVLEIYLEKNNRTIKKKIYEPDYKKGNWTIHKPQVYENRVLPKTKILPAQIHHNNDIHFYVLDNIQVINNISLPAIQYHKLNNYSLLDMNIYGKLFILPKLVYGNKDKLLIDLKYELVTISDNATNKDFNFEFLQDSYKTSNMEFDELIKFYKKFREI